MRYSIKFAVAIIVVMSMSLLPSAVAQTRTWAKMHTEVTFEQQVVANMTRILTADSQDPKLGRVLFSDGVNAPLVYRTDVTEDGPFEHSLETVSGDGGFTYSMAATGDTITLEICGDLMTLQDGDETTQAVRTQATTMFNACPQSFKDAVTSFVVLGLAHLPTVEPTAEFARDLLFPNVTAQFNPSTESANSEVVHPFDPNTTPPGTFEQQFGNHYYQ